MSEKDELARIGPNVRMLIAHKMALDAVPKGGGFNDALEFLSSKENITAGAKRATDWVKLAIKSIRQAREPNPWKDSDDESIAGELLKRINQRNGATYERER